MKKGVLVSTTEHFVGVHRGWHRQRHRRTRQPRVAILDGGARPFVDMIQKAGIQRQRKTRTYLRVVREVELREGDKFIAVYPANTYSVSYSINFPHPQIGRQTFCVQLTNGSYVREIAPARTFGFMHEAEAMRQQGLIRGASTENAIVLSRDGVLNPPLRFVDEFVRHKVLDLIGDLALIGKQILGSVVADRAGHAMHTALVSRLLRDKSYWEETTLEERLLRCRSAEARPRACRSVQSAGCGLVNRRCPRSASRRRSSASASARTRSANALALCRCSAPWRQTRADTVYRLPGGAVAFPFWQFFRRW
jgi:UDP-3-O-[3-hydroxymyristoyl] N-acetylglucosamine deacetylase